jgi:glycosyltransferase involved in cell wall biosynthesis
MQVDAVYETGGAAPYSVLMSVYRGDNAEHFRAAIDSILAQTIPTDDVVLVVDGPLSGALRDTVAACIKENPQIYPLRLPENVGLGAALQAGLPACRHDIVLRMDADDISAPTRAEKQLAFLAAHPDITLLSATMNEFIDTPDNVVAVKRVPTTHAAIIKRARRWNPMNHPAVAMRKTAAIAVGGYQHCPRYEDYHLWVRMLAAGDLAANIDEPLLAYRLSTANLNRRRATRDAITFHLWKHRIGFANWLDTAWMIAFMCAIHIVPTPIYRAIYKVKRR